ncbi:MAG: HAD family hydrolase [Bacilli bacterium]|nr:HAD family hydrolase [Bacilli bacterium]
MIIKNGLSKTDINNFKNCIFDIDGTLVKYVTMEDLITEALLYYGIEPKKEYFNMQALGVIEILEKAANEQCFTFENLCLSWDKHLTFLKEHNVKVEDFAKKMIDLEVKYVKLLPNVKDNLKYLKELKLFCSTNWFKNSQIKKLNNVGIDNYFNTIYTCEDTLAKPSKKHFKFILDKENMSADETIFIGDSASDIKSSYYGIKSILLDLNQNKEAIYDIANVVITDFADIVKVLKK